MDQGFPSAHKLAWVTCPSESIRVKLEFYRSFHPTYIGGLASKGQ